MSDEFYKALAIIIPSLFSLIGIWISSVNQTKINKSRGDVKELHDTVNGKMQQLLDVTATSSKAEGKLEEKTEQEEKQK